METRRPDDRVALAIGTLLTLLAFPPPVSACQLRTVHVNAETGDDGNAGSQGAPFKRLNFALQEAWDSLQESQTPDIVAIYVQFSTTPIAPTAPFGGNENGLEIVGNGGTISVFATDCKFLDSFPWLPASASTAAVADRSFDPLSLTVVLRNCDFRDNAYGVLWSNSNPSSVLDLGTASEHGRNNFCLDFAPWEKNPVPAPPEYPSFDPFRVCVFHRSTVLSPVSAVGNWWVRDNQGANALGHLLVGTVPSVTHPDRNVSAIHPFTGAPIVPASPPGPQWGAITPFGRIYSIRADDPSGQIDFGETSSAPAGLPPDCGSAP